MSVVLRAYTRGVNGETPEEILTEAFSKCYQKPANLDVVLRHLSHMSVLEHIAFTFDIVISRVTWEQLTRHRIASYTAQSHRYTDIQPQDVVFFIPGDIIGPDRIEWQIDAQKIFNIYKKWREKGYKKQTARYLAPMGVSIRAAWTINLRSLVNLLELRTGPHAQEEIRLFAEEVWQEVKPLFSNLAPKLEEVFRGK